MLIAQPSHTQDTISFLAAPRELTFISQHSFIQRTILCKGEGQQHLRTDEGIGILGFCGRNFPFFFQKSTEDKHSYPLVTYWTDPYRHIGASPVGPVFAGYVQGGWANSTLSQWQRAHQIPVILFLPDSFMCHPPLEAIGFPLSAPDIAAQIDSFASGQQDALRIFPESACIS